MTLKRLVVMGVAMSFGVVSFAQKSNIKIANREINNAAEAISNNNFGAALLAYQKAKAAIDTAILNPKTKDDPQTWLTKATVYINLQGNESFAHDNPYLESYEALKKAFSMNESLKNKPEAVEVTTRTAFYTFNEGVTAFNDSKYPKAIEGLDKTLELLGNDGDKRFSTQKSVDTVRAQAAMILGYASYYSDKNDKAISLLETCAKSPYLEGNGTNIYLVLAQAYEKAGNKTQQLATIENGIRKYPNDENLKSAELNYYIEAGDTKTLISKLEADVQKNPNNPQAYFSLGILYDKLADADGGAGQNEYVTKAETNLNKAIELNPDNPQIIYQLAAHYYNMAAAVNNEMSQMTGNDMKKYNALKDRRDNLFEKATPMLERAKTIYKPKAGSLKGEDRKFYVQTLTALSQIYTIQNKLEKAQENRELLNRF